MLAKIRDRAPDLPAMVFISMSKSVSRGLTTAGCLVANHTEFAKGLIASVGESGKLVDTTAKPDQKFVDLITAHPEFKPCVSFGQDNDLIYATVPATSTQGAIKAEDKAKQAIGGVQLTRLSFPPTCNTDVVGKIVTEAVKNIYSSA